MKPEIHGPASGLQEWSVEYWNSVMGRRTIMAGSWDECILILGGLYQSRLVSISKEAKNPAWASRYEIYTD